jgi:2-amino-4-hydroxy-6-hydroxymethyldihydropteridine diphosphokinase
MGENLHQVYIMLGSNIEPELNIPRAVTLLQPQVNILRHSSVWQSASVECCYPDYLNLAVLLSTPLSAEALKDQVLRPLEARMGRVRTEDKNAPRPIDLDIIIFDGELLDETIWQYSYVAVPISELLPSYRSDSGESLKSVADRLARASHIQLRTDITITLPSIP